jgi:hypothetical protein
MGYLGPTVEQDPVGNRASTLGERQRTDPRVRSNLPRGQADQFPSGPLALNISIFKPRDRTSGDLNYVPVMTFERFEQGRRWGG